VVLLSRCSLIRIPFFLESWNMPRCAREVN
jgi:hypothetical protein